MNPLFSGLTLADVHRDVLRNLVSLPRRQDLFDDLADGEAERALAARVVDEVEPPTHRSAIPIIDRPFEDAAWFNAITWPFKHRQVSRFSDGTHGVWYGADSVETTVCESAYHWYRGLLVDAGFERQAVVAERDVYLVACDAALLDFREAADRQPDLLHPSDYTYCHSVGARIHREGHPGLLARSVRRPGVENVAIFNPAVLSDPRFHCQLTYTLADRKILVEQQPGTVWLTLDVAQSPG